VPTGLLRQRVKMSVRDDLARNLKRLPFQAAPRVHSAVVHTAMSVPSEKARASRAIWPISAWEGGLVLFVLATVGAVYLWAARYWIDTFEEGYFAYLASRVAVGDHPYRDFATPYTPAFFYLHALIFKVFGYSLVWQRAGVIVARVVGAGLLYLLARRLAPARYALLAPVTFLLLDPAPVPWQTHPSWYAAACATAAALAMLRYLDSRKVNWLIAAGSLAGLGFAFKQNTGLLTLLAMLTFTCLACPIPSALPRSVAGWMANLDRVFPTSMLRLPAIAAVFVLPLALIVALWPRPQVEYGLEYVLPVLVLNFWLYRRASLDRDSIGRAIVCAGAVCLGFSLVTIPWLLALILEISRHEVPLKQFLGGVDPGGYILDQWWPHPEGLAVLSIGPFMVGACWDFANRRIARAMAWVLSGILIVAMGAWLSQVPGQPFPSSATTSGLLLTENLNQLLPAVAAGLVILACVSGWVTPGHELIVAWLLTFASTMFFHQYPRMDEPHLIFSAPPMMAALAWFFWRMESRVLVGITGRRRAAATIALTVALTIVPLLSLFPVTNWRWSMLVPPQNDIGQIDPQTYVPVENLRAGVLALPYAALPLDAVAETVRARTRDGEPIFVFPAAPMLYYLAERPNATKYNHFLPGLASLEQEHEVVRVLDERDVRLVILEPAFEFLWLREPDYPELRAFLRSQFSLTSRIGPYEVWTR
jgi:hypothetical protein